MYKRQLFILYLCLLAYFMFFSESFGRTDTDRGYAYNLVPFKEILRFIRYRGTVGLWAFLINIVGNVVAFMPCEMCIRDRIWPTASMRTGWALW